MPNARGSWPALAVDSHALDRIAAHLVKRRGDEADRKGNIRVSSSGECSRKIGYKLLGFEAEPPTVNELVTFQVGHSYHHMVQQWLIEIGWIENERFLEVLLEDGATRRKGSCDGITVPLDAQGSPSGAGTRRVIEIKSITNVAQERYGKESAGAYSRLEKPRDYHLDQANVYADLWNMRIPAEGVIAPDMEASFKGWRQRDRVTHITMIYVGKDTSDMPLKIFTQKISEQRIQRLRGKFERIWSYVDLEELPPRDHNPFSDFPPCKFCPYQTLCISEGGG